MSDKPQTTAVGPNTGARKPTRTRIVSALLNGLIAFFVVAVVRWTNVMGVDEALIQHTTWTVSRLLSSVYPPVLRSREARNMPGGIAKYAVDKITVVEIDDEYFAEAGKTPLSWP